MVKIHFPPFDKWKETKSYEEQIGDYYCAIKAVGWYMNDSNKADYQIAISTSNIPTNIYSRKIINYYKIYDGNDEQELRAWYESITKKVNEEFQNYLIETYFKEG